MFERFISKSARREIGDFEARAPDPAGHIYELLTSYDDEDKAEFNQELKAFSARPASPDHVSLAHVMDLYFSEGFLPGFIYKNDPKGHADLLSDFTQMAKKTKEADILKEAMASWANAALFIRDFKEKPPSDACRIYLGFLNNPDTAQGLTFEDMASALLRTAHEIQEKHNDRSFLPSP